MFTVEIHSEPDHPFIYVRRSWKCIRIEGARTTPDNFHIEIQVFQWTKAAAKWWERFAQSAQSAFIV